MLGGVNLCEAQIYIPLALNKFTLSRGGVRFQLRGAWSLPH